MKKNWTITQNSFDKLLDWLDEDPDKAGDIYQHIREKLIKIFVSRGFSDAEDLADEVFNRVISKIETLSQEFTGEKSLFFYGVASKILLEANRRKEVELYESVQKPPLQNGAPNLKLECLDECIKKLSAAQHNLIVAYYELEKSEKVQQRMDLAKQFNLNINSLRVQVCRIRAALKDCIQDCSSKFVRFR